MILEKFNSTTFYDHIIEDLVKIKDGNRDNAAMLNGAKLKTISECHLGKVANIDIKAITKKLPVDDPVSVYINSLPDEPNPDGWDDWW